jgi:hypothetical protein
MPLEIRSPQKIQLGYPDLALIDVAFPVRSAASAFHSLDHSPFQQAKLFIKKVTCNWDF